jgi:hypothetical protein
MAAWKGHGRRLPGPNSKQRSRICLQGLRNTKIPSWDSRSEGQHLNPGPPEYGAGQLVYKT